MSTSAASRASRSASIGSVRSAPTNRAEPPPFSISATTATPRVTSRPCTTTVAPCAANCTAAACPIPDVAPVTSATSPSRSRTTVGLIMTTPQAFEPICLIDSTQHAPAGGLFLALTGYDLPQAAQLGGPLLQLTPCLPHEYCLEQTDWSTSWQLI